MNAEVIACLRNLRATAEADRKENFARAFGKALKSVEKCREQITSVEQVRTLNGVGPYIAARIEKHLRENPPGDAALPAARRAAQREYEPRYGSSPFGLLIALLEAEIDIASEPVPMEKDELVALAQKYCDEPLVKVRKRAGDYHDGWSSMNATLVKRGLVFASGKPRRFELTDSGRVLARRLLTKLNALTANGSQNDFSAGGSVSTPARGRRRSTPVAESNHTPNPIDQNETGSSLQATAEGCSVQPTGPEQPIHPVGFDVLMIVDNREVYGSGNSRKSFHSKIADGELESVEFSQLEAGDAVFVARIGGSEGETFVLDYLIERKTVTDYVESIMDGRYARQKYFMKKTKLSNLIIVVEGDLSKQNQIPTAALQKEIVRSEVADGFLIYQSRSLEDTINLYRNMHKWVRRKYARWSLEDLTRERTTLTEWTQMVKEAQRLKVQDVFWQMLMQIPGLGRKRIQRMTQVGGVRTLAGLIDAYWKCDTSQEGRRVLCDLATECNTGIHLSSAVYELFTSSTYGDMRFKRRRVGDDEPPSEGGGEQAALGTEPDLGLEEREQLPDVGRSGSAHSSAAAVSRPCAGEPSDRPQSPIIID